MLSLYLASGSPRRRELLTQLGLTFERLVTDVEEQRQNGEEAERYVRRLAREKAQAGVEVAPADLPVLGADTIVVLNNQVLEKPADGADAAKILALLSGQTHRVMTAVALADRQQTLDCLTITEVTFRLLTPRTFATILPAGNRWIKPGRTGFRASAATLSEKLTEVITRSSDCHWWKPPSCSAIFSRCVK